MENVKGLLSAKVNGRSMFGDILSDLKDPAAVFKNHSNKKTASNTEYAPLWVDRKVTLAIFIQVIFLQTIS